MLSIFKPGSPTTALSSRFFPLLQHSFRCRSTSSTIETPSQPPHEQDPDSHKKKAKPSNSRVKPVKGEVDLDHFRTAAWVPETPMLLRASHSFPAMQKWFNIVPRSKRATFTQYLRPHKDTLLPYEFTFHHVLPDEEDSVDRVFAVFLTWIAESSEYNQPYLIAYVEYIRRLLIDTTWPRFSPLVFRQFQAPLSLIMSASQFNATEAKRKSTGPIKNLYIAQCKLDDLPDPLSEDLPTPDIVKHAGKGDIYDSSIWLGLQPTYTPLHRDPNPNLFCQLIGSKRIRLLAPDQGDDLYARVRRAVGSEGDSRFRTTEMMEGRERDLLHRMVWEDESVGESIDEVSLNPSDALFIPKGWWHSVATSDRDGWLNASVNWWFR